jgi:hypothetical protein
MLVILSGLETIHKKFLARKIIAALNTFTVDGYTVDFNIEPFKVTDANGKIVYCMAHGEQPMTNELLLDLDNDGVIDPEGTATFDKIVQMNDDLFLTGGRVNHFNGVFLDLAYDYGITEINDYSIDNMLIHPHTYNDVLENYKNRIADTHVITGIFSKVFIDSIRADLGAENVTVLNIIRNPSTCVLLNPKNDEYYEDPTKERTLDSDHVKLMRSLENAIILSEVDYITTIRFEDIITAGKFTVNGIEVSLPSGYENYNGILTQYEKENIIPLNLVSEQQLEEQNAILHDQITNYYLPVLNDEDLNFLNNLKTIPFQSLAELHANLLAKSPRNIFARLGYEPLSYDDIVS